MCLSQKDSVCAGIGSAYSGDTSAWSMSRSSSFADRGTSIGTIGVLVFSDENESNIHNGRITDIEAR